jgi:hypothetical protein
LLLLLRQFRLLVPRRRHCHRPWRLLRRSVPPSRPWMRARLPSSSPFAYAGALLDLCSLLLFSMTRSDDLLIFGSFIRRFGLFVLCFRTPLGLAASAGAHPAVRYTSLRACSFCVLFVSLQLGFVLLLSCADRY